MSPAVKEADLKSKKSLKKQLCDSLCFGYQFLRKVKLGPGS